MKTEIKKTVAKTTSDSMPLFNKQHSDYCGLCKQNTPCKHLPKKIKDSIGASKEELIEGLQQKFKTKDERYLKLSEVLSNNGDYWQTTGRVKRTILTHDAVKKLADTAGLSKAPEYVVLTQPDAMNNYQYTIQARVCKVTDKNDCVVEIGEANRSNLGSKGRGNPANMAQKRAYDRAVLRLLGITGLLSAEELSDEETKDTMEGLSHEDKKAIAPIVNKLILASNKDHLIVFNKEMKEKAKRYSAEQLDYLRKLYRKKVGEITKTKF